MNDFNATRIPTPRDGGSQLTCGDCPTRTDAKYKVMVAPGRTRDLCGEHTQLAYEARGVAPSGWRVAQQWGEPFQAIQRA